MEFVTGTTSEVLMTTFNGTLSPNPNDSFKFINRTQRITVGMIFIIVSIIGSIGNSLVIVAVAVSRKLRTITNVFVVNLAVADLLTSLSLPWNAVALISQDGWPLHPLVCTLAGATMYLCIIASLYSLASIGINRFILVTKKHLTYQRVFTRFNLVLWIISIWVISFLLVVFLPVIDIGGLGYNEKYSVCGQSSSHPQDDTYQLVQAIGSFPIPLIIISYSYIKIYLHVRKHMRVMSKHISPVDSNLTDTTTVAALPTERISGDQTTHAENCQHDHMQTTETSITSGEDDNRVVPAELQTWKTSTDSRNSNNNNNKMKKTSVSRFSLSFRRGSSVNRRQLQITKNMFLVMCTFFVCIAPFTVCLFFDDSDPFVPYASALVLCNGAINPFIYATKHPVFKTVMLALIKCRKHS